MRHPVLPRGAELRLPILSGILLTLSFPPFHLLLPPFVALVPYVIFLDRCADDPSTGPSAARGAFWMGIIFYGTLLYWLFTALVYYTWLALLGYLITIVVLSGFLAGVGWSVRRLRARHGVPAWASLPVFWTAAEWLPGHLHDLSFPWLGLGHSLSGFPALVGFADVVGARGVTAWLVLINALAAGWWLAGLKVRPVRRAAVLALAIGVPICYSLARWLTLDTRPAATVAVVQPNIPEDIKLDRDAARDSSRVALGRLTREGLAGRADVELLVWPETALPGYYEREAAWTDWARALAASHATAMVMGTLDLELNEALYDRYNSALFIDDMGGEAGLYRKHYLVPVVERVPFLPQAWIDRLQLKALRGWEWPLIGDVGAFLQYFGGFGRGRTEPLFQANGSRFGVLICYESIFAGLARTYRRAGADFLVNITNDAWFGREEPVWSRTSALYQHPAHLVMRAIENRVGVARAANTGISMFVDPRGRVYEATELFEPDVRVADVLTSDGRTIYTRLGDWPGWLAATAAAFSLIASWWRKAVGSDR